MKYSALRNPYSTSCYGILSNLFWGGYTYRIPLHRKSTTKKLDDPLTNILEIINILC